jgi:hypothetical protein
MLNFNRLDDRAMARNFSTCSKKSHRVLLDEIDPHELKRFTCDAVVTKRESASPRHR